MIKIKSLLMTTEIDLIGEKQPFLTDTSWWYNAGKNMKRDSASAFVHMRRDIPFPCTQLYAFWMTSQSPTPHPPVAYVLN